MRRVLFVCALALSTVALADQAPMVLVHTGFLLDGSDQPVTEPQLAMTFRIFDRSAPVAGETKLWEGTCPVDVSNGHYAATLGGECGTGLLPSMLPTDEARYLEVSVGTTPLLPRMLIGTVPTAAVATNALAVGGASLDALDARYARFQAAPATPQSGSLALDGSVSAANVSASGHVVGADAELTNGLSAASATLTGALAAASVSGDGSLLTNLDASTIASGTLDDARLAPDVARTGSDLTFTGHATFANATGAFAGSFSGDGAALTNLDAGALTGTLSDARLAPDVARTTGAASFSGAVGASGFSTTGIATAGRFVGDGSGLRNLSTDAASITFDHTDGRLGAPAMSATDAQAAMVELHNEIASLGGGSTLCKSDGTNCLTGAWSTATGSNDSTTNLRALVNRAACESRRGIWHDDDGCHEYAFFTQGHGAFDGGTRCAAEYSGTHLCTWIDLWSGGFQSLRRPGYLSTTSYAWMGGGYAAYQNRMFYPWGNQDTYVTCSGGTHFMLDMRSANGTNAWGCYSDGYDDTSMCCRDNPTSY